MHSSIEGFVVCEEHKETLLAAWDHYEAVQVDKEAEVKELYVPIFQLKLFV